MILIYLNNKSQNKNIEINMEDDSEAIIKEERPL